MINKFWASIAVFMVFTSLIYFNNQPVFSGYATNYTLALDDYSSCARFKNTSALLYPFNFNKYGESCVINKADFDMQQFVQRFNATLIFTETLVEGVNYYFYSNQVKYQKTLLGKKVNLHVYVCDDTVTLGAPLIFYGY